MKQEVSVELTGGRRLSFETGNLAKQAHGWVVVRTGDNVVLATATSNPDPREGIDFFPLTVDYREYTYAGGRIPGGFIKREGRMSEREVLTSRQIDRPVRPVFAPSPTFLSSARSAPCASAWLTDASLPIPPIPKCATACSTSWSSAPPM